MNEQSFWETSPENELPPTSLALTVPKDVSEISAGSNQLVTVANEFIVDSEAAFQVADEVQARLKAEAKAINEKRLEFTRPIDAIKKKWMDFFSPAVDSRTKAAGIYQTKMSGFLRQQREENERKQREAEALQAERQRELQEEARKLEEKAAQRKTEAARGKLLAEAENLRNISALTPTSVPVAPPPQTVASNVAELWELDRVENMPEFLRWLADHPEWHGVITLKTSEINRMARQFNTTVPVPGVKFHQRDSFRSKASR